MKIKHLLLLCSALAVTCTASAESYRMMQLVSDKLDLDQLAAAVLDADKFGRAIDGTEYSIIEYVVIHLDADGLGEIDQTYSVKYAQSYSDSGEPQEPAIRKVGIEAKIQRQPNGEISLTYSSTMLERWHFYGPNMTLVQPVFSARSFRNPNLTLLPGNQITLLGGVIDDAKQQRLFLIQRIPSPALPAPSK